MLFNIWVTNNCNFRCRYCYVPQYMKNMEQDTADKVIDFIKEMAQLDEDKEIIINFHGGEPLLNFDLIQQIMGRCKKIFERKNLLFGITTNGSMLTKEIAEILVDNFKYNLSISLDGSKEVNDFNRRHLDGSGTYDRIIDNLLYIKTLDPYVRVRVTYNTKTVRCIFNSIRHIVELGFKKIVAVPDFTDENWNDKYVEILAEELELIYKRFYQIKDVDINIISDDIRRKKSCCHGGKKSLNIDVDGNIFPCTWTIGNDEFLIGNINKGIDIDKVDELLSYSLKDIRECSGCNLKESCISNRCRMINKVITGDFCKIPEIRCEYNNIIYNLQKKYSA